MAATTKTYRDGNGDPFTGREWDDGTANSAVTILGDGAGAELAKAEDAAAVSGDKGLVVLGVRRDTPASSSGTDGDYSTFNFDATGNLYTTGSFSGSVTITAGATSIAKAEDVASANADVGVPAMAIQKATPADTAGTDGDYAMLQMSAGRLWTSSLLKDAAAGTLVKAEDDAAVSGDLGLVMLGVRRDSPASSSGTDGDYSTFNFDSIGNLRVNATVSTGALAGDVAHDAADSGNPVKGGHKATTSLSALTLVANADRTDSFAGVDGVQIIRPHCNLEDIVSGNATNTDGTSTQCIAAQASGIKTYLTSVILCNTSATAITVDIKDGSTVKVSLPLPAGSGCIFNPPVPIPGTAATAWNFDGSAAATTVTCSMVGFKSKV